MTRGILLIAIILMAVAALNIVTWRMRRRMTPAERKLLDEEVEQDRQDFSAP